MRPTHQAAGAQRSRKGASGKNCKNCTGEKETSAENQGDAILRALEANESDRGEYKGEQAADDLQVALKERIRMKSNATQPGSGENEKKESPEVREEDCRGTALVRDRSLSHGTVLRSAVHSWGPHYLHY